MTNAPNPAVVDTDTLSGEMRPVRRAALALGSNLGDRLDTMQAGLNVLTESAGIVTVAISSVYETEAVGGPADNPPFLNAVLVIDTTLGPRALLERSLSTEDAFGRSREVPDGPRTLDVDVLAVGDRQVEDDDLRVPHPRLSERAFVLVPWAEVDPTFEIPGLGTVLQVRNQVSDSTVRRLRDAELELPA
ncbi:MAG TPA: 2-amino-4-hydroxy-6-hydroxymethyldihydropteridine diphosphokinase [Jiangellaceae bacterium]|nr:2-amino-4-hydroxy-6-hydroxymethyldihydropteridine diphosphokinase [Jiangellaceae bacterium]